MRCSPDRINHLESNQVFVFGSNTEGRHGAGAAKVAVRFGAKYGVSTGRQGQAYAICTKDLGSGRRSISLPEIGNQIDEFLVYAKNRPEEEFLVTAIGTGLGGYEVSEIAELLRDREIPTNVLLPRSFLSHLQLTK